MSTNTTTTNRDDSREAVRTLAAAALLAVDEIEKTFVAEIADFRAKMRDAWRWGDGSRLPKSARHYAAAQENCYEGWSYRFDPYDDLSVVLYTAFDWMNRCPDRSIELDVGMRSLDAAVQLFVGRDKAVMSAICDAVGYDTSRLTERGKAPCDEETPGDGDASGDTSLVNLEDARLSRDIADVGARIDEQSIQADALAREIEAMSDFVYSALRARGAHLTLVSNDVNASDSPSTR